MLQHPKETHHLYASQLVHPLESLGEEAFTWSVDLIIAQIKVCVYEIRSALSFSLPAAMNLPTDISVETARPPRGHVGSLRVRLHPPTVGDWSLSRLIVATNTRQQFVGFSRDEDAIMYRGARNSF